MSPLSTGRRHLIGLAALAAMVASACGGGYLGAKPDTPMLPATCVTEGPQVRTPGIGPYLSLGPGVAPDLVAFHGETLFVTALDPCTDTHELVLWQVDTRSRATTAIPLGITTGGLWHALGVAEDGTVWVGTRDVLVHVHRDRSLEWISVPAAQSPVPAGFTSRAGAQNAVGAITSLAAVGDTLLLGRAGHREITRFDTIAQRFTHIVLPTPFGEVKTIVRAPGTSAIFTTTRSSTDPTGTRDATGAFDVGSSRTAELPISSGVLVARGDSVAYVTWTATAGTVRADLSVVDARGAKRWSTDAHPYDATRFALRGDGEVAVRVSGAAAEVAFLGPDGLELRRIAYAATRDPAAPAVPALAFASFGPGDDLWFAVRGRPEIYRIK